MSLAESLSSGLSGSKSQMTGSRSLPAVASKLRAPELPPALREELRRLGEASPAPTAKAAKDPTPKQRLIQRATMGWTTAEQAAVNRLGYDGYLERQLDYESIDDSALEEALGEALPSLSMTPDQILSTFGDDPGKPAFDLLIATIYRSAYSPRQLLERMVVFWSDHFSINLFGDLGFFLKPIDDRDVIRRHALGRFPDLLKASARSPAMLTYLTNDTNIKDHPNENYARELMELHTMGADRGYTEEDVKEVARAFTGWTVGRFGREYGHFQFRNIDHDTDAKTVLGRVIAAGGGQRDGEIVLTLLGRHRNTAEFVARKMLRYMWGYEPGRGMVDRVAETYLDTGGDIREMLRVILRQAWMATATPKLKRPYHHLISTLRALGAEVDEPFYLIDQLYVAGHLPFTWEPPNGFPDSEDFWSGFILPRWNFAAEFLSFGTGVNVDIPAIDPARNAALTRAKVRGRLNRQLMGGRMSAPTKAGLRDFLAAVPLNRNSVREAIGLAVASPDFQSY